MILPRFRGAANRLQVQLQRLRKKQQLTHSEQSQRNAALQNYKHAVEERIVALKRKMKSFLADRQQAVTQLCSSAHHSASMLSLMLAQVEKLLALQEQARRSETEKERVWPVEPKILLTTEEESKSADHEPPQSLQSLDPELTGEGPTAQQQKSPLALATEEEQALLAIQPFYRRLNRVQLECAAIEEEHHRLIEENRQIKQQLKVFVDGVTVPSDAVDSMEQTLLIVNERLQKTRQMPSTNRQVTVQNLPTTQRNYQLQLQGVAALHR